MTLRVTIVVIVIGVIFVIVVIVIVIVVVAVIVIIVIVTRWQGSDVTIELKREMQSTTIGTTPKQQQPTLFDCFYSNQYNNLSPDSSQQ